MKLGLNITQKQILNNSVARAWWFLGIHVGIKLSAPGSYGGSTIMSNFTIPLFAICILVFTVYGNLNWLNLKKSQVYEEVIELTQLRQLAEDGNPKNQINLAKQLITNKLYQKISAPGEAVKWCLAAAEQGNVSAQKMLGLMYAYGADVKQDYSEAAQWYQAAAEQGDANSQYNLGKAYLKGQGVDQSNSEAKKWLQKAARQEHTKAQKMLDEIILNEPEGTH